MVHTFSAAVCLRRLLHHILSLIAYAFREKRDLVFIIAQFMMNTNGRIRFGLQIVFARLYITPSHYHHYANLSEDIELIKCLSDIFVECVNKIKHIFFQFSVIQHMGLCVFSLPISLGVIERIYIYTLSYYHHQIGSTNYRPSFMVRSWKNGMRCMSRYILIICTSRLERKTA